MEDYVTDFMEFVKKPAVVETFVDVLLCAVPIWLAVMIGVVIGWSWTPRWTSLVFLGLRSKISRFAWTAPPGFGGRRLWLAFTALSAFSVGRRLWSRFRGRRKRKKSDVPAPPAPPAPPAASAVDGDDIGDTSVVSPVESAQSADGNCCDVKCSIVTSGGDHDIVMENDLEHLLHLLDSKKDDMAWQSMMERSTTDLACQGWRYEAETGPIMYCTKTIFEDASPELVRDFFWDDEFRPKWDPMLTHIKILEECPRTGAMIVHWIKKFPFFCSDREYIIGRKIWEAGKAYYCVTKGVPYPALQKRDKPRRVDLYFSSWVIRPVLSRKGDGQLSSCEVILVHYEDMGIPRDVAKLGVRHGMWGTVKKLHAGFRAYQQARKLEASLSRCALMARITTKISFGGSTDLPEPTSDEQEPTSVNNIKRVKGDGGIDWRWIVIGGAVAVVCGLQTGAIGKGLLMGAAQRFARRR